MRRKRSMPTDEIDALRAAFWRCDSTIRFYNRQLDAGGVVALASAALSGLCLITDSHWMWVAAVSGMITSVLMGTYARLMIARTMRRGRAIQLQMVKRMGRLP